MQPVIPIIILALPLAMFLVLGLFGNKMSHRLAGVLGTAGMGVTMVLPISPRSPISSPEAGNFMMQRPIHVCSQ